MSRAKIICTLGPSSQDETTIRGLIDAGMNIARINFSHGAAEELSGIIATVRKVAAEKDIPIAILGDLAGPKIRVGDIENGQVTLEAGKKLTITTRTVMGSSTLVSTNYPNLVSDLDKGDRILLDDGNLELKVLDVTSEEVKTAVIIGGVLKRHKGMNFPGVAISAPSISAKDFSDMEFAVKNGLDFLGLSFVRTPDDVLKAKKLLSHLDSDMPVIAKIEKQEAVDSFADILEIADGIMVARGDLGVEMPSEQVPLIQKKIIAKCNVIGKPVIIATQMLESMTFNSRPTRAETSDVANAVLDGSDAVMLSGETAVGKYPVKAVESMRKIVHGVENELGKSMGIVDRGEQESTIHGAVTIAACRAAEILNAAAIVAYTQSGSTARHLSMHRPLTPIVAVTPCENIRRRMVIHWGIHTVLVKHVVDTDSMVSMAEKVAKNSGYARSGDIIVIISGTPIGISGSTNIMKVHLIP